MIWSAQARRDLVAVRHYIAQDKPSAATRVATTLISAAESLDRFPGRGRDGIVAGTRELVSKHPYIIVYRVSPSQVRILRIRHGAQDRTRL